MLEEQEEQIPATEVNEETSPETKIHSVIHTIRDLVDAKVVTAIPVVQERLIEARANIEIDKRVTAVSKVLGLLESSHLELRKLKPDVNTFDAEGKPISSTYSKDVTEKRKTLKEKIEKMEKALNSALDQKSPNFEGVYKLGSSGDNKEAK